MKKLLLLLLFVTFIFSCAEENKKVNELEEENENLNDKTDKLDKKDNNSENRVNIILIKEQNQILYHLSGKFTGTAYRINSKDEIIWECDYIDGEANGIQKVWSNSIYGYQEMYMKNNSRHGPYKSYWHNGNLESEGYYYEGDEVGEWIYYNPDGTGIKKYNY